MLQGWMCDFRIVLTVVITNFSPFCFGNYGLSKNVIRVLSIDVVLRHVLRLCFSSICARVYFASVYYLTYVIGNISYCLRFHLSPKTCFDWFRPQPLEQGYRDPTWPSKAAIPSMRTTLLCVHYEEGYLKKEEEENWMNGDHTKHSMETFPLCWPPPCRQQWCYKMMTKHLQIAKT